MTKKRNFIVFLMFIGLLSTLACGTSADKLGIGAECKDDTACNADDKQKCLTEFRGGYCGSADCTKDSDCPTGSLCIAHTPQKNYCFRSCNDKVDCNKNRVAANESNCSANVTTAEGKKGVKACVPPSG